SGKDRGRPRGARRCRPRGGRGTRRPRRRAPEGEEPAPGGARARPQVRQRQGEPARLLRRGLRRLPRAVRPRSRLERRHGRRRAARGGEVPRAHAADRRRPRARPDGTAARDVAAEERGDVVRRIVLAAALALVAAGAAAGDDEMRLPPVAHVTFENGLRVQVAEYHELPLVEFYLMIGAGAAQDPPGKDGLAALTAGTLRRG